MSTTVKVAPEFRTTLQIAADERLAWLYESGMISQEKEIPIEEYWAFRGMLFAEHLGFAKSYQNESHLRWGDGFRRHLIEQHPELEPLLTKAAELTPEIEQAVRHAAIEYRTRFQF